MPTGPSPDFATATTILQGAFGRDVFCARVMLLLRLPEFGGSAHINLPRVILIGTDLRALLEMGVLCLMVMMAICLVIEIIACIGLVAGISVINGKRTWRRIQGGNRLVLGEKTGRY